MAERIGFIRFTAFDLRGPDQYAGLRTRVPNYFEDNPVLPPWKQLSVTGFVKPEMPTPDQLAPLMNEYHRYFLERAVQHEMYVRWWRRERAYKTAENIAYARYDQLHDHIVDKWIQKTYEHKGRMHEIFQNVGAKLWQDREVMHRELEENFVRSQRDTRALNAKAEHQRLISQQNFTRPVHTDAMPAALPKLTADPLQVFPHRAKVTSYLESISTADIKQREAVQMASIPRSQNPEAVQPSVVDASERVGMMSVSLAKRQL